MRGLIFAVVTACFLSTCSMMPALANPPGWPSFSDAAPPRVERRAPRVVVRKKPRVASWSVVVAPKPPPARCLTAFESVGDQAMTQSGAQDAAEKAWQQMLRFERGELFADPAHAIEKQWWCVKSSVGQGLFYRCRLRAQPCSPEAK